MRINFVSKAIHSVSHSLGESGSNNMKNEEKEEDFRFFYLLFWDCFVAVFECIKNKRRNNVKNWLIVNLA